jgi:hypothetical protein
MASGNYAKKPVQSAPKDDRTLIPARATRRLSAVTEDPDTESITFSRDSASLRPPTTDRMEVQQTRVGNKTTPNTTKTPNMTNVTRIPSNTSATKTPSSKNTTRKSNTTNVTRIPDNASATKTPTAANKTRTLDNTNTAMRTLNLRKAENSTLILPESRRVGKPTRSLVESTAENVTTVLPETLEEHPTRILPTTQTIRAVNIDRALTHDIPLVRMERHQPWMKPWLICFIFAIVSLFVLISAGIFQRADTISLYNGGQTYSIQVGGTQSQDWQNTKPQPIKKSIPVATGPYAVLHAPTITADFINKVLAAANSPAAGKGQSLYDLGVQYGIDPVFALAFFQHESDFGTAGEATKTLSLGNLRCYNGVTCVDTEIGGGYAQYTSWEEGFTAWYALIRDYYVNQLGLTTIDVIIPTYAPTSDHNDEAAYIADLKLSIDQWHAGIV